MPIRTDYFTARSETGNLFRIIRTTPLPATPSVGAAPPPAWKTQAGAAVAPGPEPGSFVIVHSGTRLQLVE